MPDEPIIGAIEAGGTKFVLAIGRAYDQIIAQTIIPTTTPDETLSAAISWFQEQSAQHGKISALGISCFGPVELDQSAPEWGYITQTTKPHWSDTDVAPYLGKALACPVGFDTDVNGAILGEYAHGAAQGCDAIYITVGTGIGAGAIVNGALVHGAAHPEMGHIYPRRHKEDMQFKGICSFHGDCLEGLASGPAIMVRWGASLSDLPNNHEAHDIIADYLAQLCTTTLALYSPQRIILGGGVMQSDGLLENVKMKVEDYSNGYFVYDKVRCITAPLLGNLSGITGAFELALRALDNS